MRKLSVNNSWYRVYWEEKHLAKVRSVID